MNWFEIDKAGLAKLLERRGKAWVLAELLQNAWDAPGTRNVELELAPVVGRALCTLGIVDDSPAGFTDLSHAFTLFGESIKKADPSLRGRFNLGEKLVLALCAEAEIATTTGTVRFQPDGTRSTSRSRRDAGTRFSATIRMTREEMNEAIAFAQGFLPPKGIRTTINGAELVFRPPLRVTETVLPTEVADAEGVLRRTRRKTPVSIHRPLPGQSGRIYEMGIPIVETGDAYDVDIGQKVPVSLERDSVSPSYLRDVRVAVLNAMADSIAKEEANSPWIEDALDDESASDAAVRAVVEARFGPKVVAYDPSDKEANARAVANGYSVVHGGSLSSQMWQHVRRSEAMLPAGRVTPTPKPFSEDGSPAVRVPPTDAMSAFEAFCKELAREVMGVDISVDYFESFNATAAYGSRRLSFNVGHLGTEWFERIGSEQIDLVVHEFGHEYASDHLSDKYYRALTSLAGRAVVAALERPAMFDLSTYGLEPASARP